MHSRLNCVSYILSWKICSNYFTFCFTGSMTDLVGLGGLSNVVPHTFTNPEPSSKAYRRSSRARNISTVIVSERACSSPQNKCQTATAVNLLSMDGNDESESTTKKSSELLDSPIAPILASKKLHQKLLQKTPSNQPPTVHCSSVLPADNCTSPVKDKSTRNNTDLVEASAPSNKGDTPTIPTTTDLSATPRRRRSSRKRTTMSSSVDLISDSDESLFHGGTSEDSFKVDNPSSSSSDSTNSDCSSHSVHDVLNRKTHSSKSRNLEIAEMDDSDDERPTVPQKKIRKRRKGAKCSREERSRKKYLRNSGQEYEKHDPNSKTPVRAARQRKPPHTCKTNYCQDIITDDVGDSIFHEYWDQQSYEKRVSYVCARVEIKPVKTKRPRLPAGHKKSHPKSVSHKYCFHIHGESKQVCKSTFLNTLGETDGFVYLATKKKLKSLSGTVAQDKRGRHAPKHKLKPDVIDEVKTHVLRFPSYKSHYKRSEVGDTRYLPSHLDIRQMYNMYISEGHKYVSYSTYERIFNTLGRSFKKPATDTCSKCDTWNQMINTRTTGIFVYLDLPEGSF
ncbi:uncharacterized protein LOC127751316 [Frankliniella occidentalis]|uniref:Uncharacterized protein LOC127751316 n=1 Tax=Frankliniella occidentalis TaxID=133901 RepID=A0A9C6X7Q7_FRAOC|nr:uncharacterized protein LOC127751316 [Frankliniella occidentalis]